MTPSTTTSHPEKKTRKISGAPKVLSAIIFWVGLWVIAAAKTGQELLLPSPLRVLETFLSLCSQWEFWLTVLITLGRIFAGTVIGITIGTAFAVLTCGSSIFNTLLSPMIRIVRATPIASFIILVRLWIDKVRITSFISALTVIPIVWGALVTGIEQTDRRLLEMGRAYGFSRWKKVRLIYIPSVLPSWSSACATAMGMAWKSGIAAEVLCQPKNSIGLQLYNSKIYLETPALFAWTATVIIMSFLLEKGFTALIRGQK